MSNALLMPGHRICEYKLIIPLSESFQETVMKLQVKFFEKYKISLPATKPLLTILHCHAYEGMQDKLIERIQQVATRTATFVIELENFKAYPEYSICIPVAAQNVLQELITELKVVKSITKLPEHEPHFVTEPHVVIAKKLKPFQFIRMWMDCEHQQFTGKFTANGMVLLKRSITTKNYEALHRFELASVSSCVKQGVLFG